MLLKKQQNTNFFTILFVSVNNLQLLQNFYFYFKFFLYVPLSFHYYH
jgi:hypothetical protein